MFRILFFVLICSILLYIIWGLYTPTGSISNQELDSSYQTYLSEAIERNTIPSESYEVIFNKTDFTQNNSSASINTTVPINSNQGEYGTNGSNIEIIQGENSSIPNSLAINNNTSTHSENSSSTAGNFGTPDIEVESSVSSFNSDCSNGLIFDPCLVLGDAEPASGGMYFGSDRDIGYF